MGLLIQKIQFYNFIDIVSHKSSPLINHFEDKLKIHLKDNNTGMQERSFQHTKSLHAMLTNENNSPNGNRFIQFRVIDTEIQ